MIRNRTAVLLSLLLAPCWAFAQASDSETEIACQGTAVYFEDFEAGIPAGWVIWDADGRTPFAAMGLLPGWQGVQDYQDTTNHVAASPSYYSPVGASDDWLVSPAVALPAVPCLSWSASSVDGAYPEAYEVRIALGTDSAALVSSVVVDTVWEEQEDWTLHSLDLTAFAGQTVHVAFHQFSDDKFVLALDDVSITSIHSLDIGVWSLSTVTATPGDTVFLRGRMMNFGTTTVTGFTVSYQVEGGLVFSTVVDSVEVGLNNGVNFTMTNGWITEATPKIYDVCVFTTLPNSLPDQDVSNDTLCQDINIGGAIGVGDKVEETVVVYPNPAQGSFRVEVPAGQWQVRLISLDGRVVLESAFEGSLWQAETASLTGLHLLQCVDTRTGQTLHGKVLLH